MKDEKEEGKGTNGVRIQKFLADSGIASRRKAEELIEFCEITINGKTATIGQKIDPAVDKVLYKGKPVHPISKRVVIALNKPRGVVSSNSDPHNLKTVFDILPKPYCNMKLFCAGRLDKESEGLLILTNDGELANRLTHPSSEIIKRYWVTLHKPFDTKKIPAMLEGIDCEGEKLFATKVIPCKSPNSKANRRLEIHLQQGRKREIRRLLEALGYYVEELVRFQIGKYTLRKIPHGGMLVLSEKEINLLFS